MKTFWQMLVVVLLASTVFIESTTTGTIAPATSNGLPEKSSAATGKILGLPEENQPKCGVERQPVKVLEDGDATALLASDAKDATIAVLSILQAPNGKELLASPSERFPLEKQWGKVRVPALIVGYKQETGTKEKPGDFDFHIVIRDSQTPQYTTMIAEIPFPACVPKAHADIFVQLAKLQQRFAHDFGTPPGKDLKLLPKPIAIHATGLVFFDLPHNDERGCLPGEQPTKKNKKGKMVCAGQDGVAKNGIELHPLLDWTID